MINIARAREIIGKATPGPMEAYMDTCGILDCAEYNVRGLASGHHGMFANAADAEFHVAARDPESGWPAALDEIERLREELKHRNGPLPLLRTQEELKRLNEQREDV